MSHAVALQMDPIERIKTATDSSFVLGLEAQRRGHTLFYYNPSDMSLDNGEVMAWVRPIQLRQQATDHFTLGEATRMNLREMKVILLRQDPPFDMQYMTTTYHLERLQPHTLVVNNPTEVRNCPEKLFVCDFPALMTPTLITQDMRDMEAFRKEHGEVVLKPLYAFGGKDVFHIKPGDSNFEGLVELFLRTYNAPMILQKFLPSVAQGDKRIVLVDGKPIGALNRIPKPGHIRSNMAVGGTPEKTTLTAREHEICEAIGPELKRRGLLLVGIDVIGGNLTEINVTSPTGLQVINRLDGISTEALVWDAIESHL